MNANRILVVQSVGVIAIGVLGGCAGSSETRVETPRSTEVRVEAHSPEGPEGVGFQKGAQVPFEKRDHSQIVAALRSAGLTVCRVQEFGGTAANDYAHWTISVTPDECPGDISSASYRPAELVVVRAFNTRQARDVLAFKGMGDGLVYWLHGDLTVSVTESSRPETIAKVEEAMRSVPGAVPGLDRRAQ